ncbi:conjugal transfer protein TraU [Rhodovastum atsumiense]|uniref:Conjugal transfer protein TraU n=2 Tax=Rhodovastum atsumiense TaxID=504468 RepID=A0A5M6IJV4_9PROT|nr:conjugal transfer protein TraU [Rhodovastum atsumiense]
MGLGRTVALAASRPDCRDGSVLSARIITDICWDCVFPIRIGGATIAGASNAVPSGAATNTVCVCNDGAVPHPGITVGMWMPFQVAEIVRTPGCSPSMGGIMLPAVDPLTVGTKGRGDGDHGDSSYFHFHMYSFPIFRMLDLFYSPRCFSGMLSDFDILFLSEVDPTWTYDELSFFNAPESAAVALPPAQMACLGDAAAALAGTNLDTLFWCAGSWGAIYPLSGNAIGQISPVSTMSLLATRGLAVQHRRGLATRTMGDDMVCGGASDPFMAKSQYRMSLFWPRAEANGKHVIGQTTLVWGDWRQIPAIGEDGTFLIWRWVDCCLELL